MNRKNDGEKDDDHQFSAALWFGKNMALKEKMQNDKGWQMKRKIVKES